MNPIKKFIIYFIECYVRAWIFTFVLFGGSSLIYSFIFWEIPNWSMPAIVWWFCMRLMGVIVFFGAGISYMEKGGDVRLITNQEDGKDE